MLNLHTCIFVLILSSTLLFGGPQIPPESTYSEGFCLLVFASFAAFCHRVVAGAFLDPHSTPGHTGVFIASTVVSVLLLGGYLQIIDRLPSDAISYASLRFFLYTGGCYGLFGTCLLVWQVLNDQELAEDKDSGRYGTLGYEGTAVAILCLGLGSILSCHVGLTGKIYSENTKGAYVEVSRGKTIRPLRYDQIHSFWSVKMEESDVLELE